MNDEINDQLLKAVLSSDEVTVLLEDIFGVGIAPIVLYQGEPRIYPQEVSKYFSSKDILQRDIRIKAPCGERGADKTVLFARSWLAMNAFDKRFREFIHEKKMTLGHIIKKRRLAAEYRNIDLKEVRSKKLSAIFEARGTIRLIRRSRMILIEKNPVILIHEYMPKSPKADSRKLFQR